jgi:uncharacterized protein (TIGR02217 family)
MSNTVFPTFPGLTFDVTRTPVWSTTTKSSVSQREFRIANSSYPVYHFKLAYEVLRQTPGYTEMATLVGFFNARNGSFDSFLFTDPDDNAVTLQAIGIGDGGTTLFQLVRSFGGYVEPVFDTNGAPALTVNGVAQVAGSDYTISATGLVTFTVAPGVGFIVKWTGSYYRRVRFSTDSAEFQKFLRDLWTLKTIELQGFKA